MPKTKHRPVKRPKQKPLDPSAQAVKIVLTQAQRAANQRASAATAGARGLRQALAERAKDLTTAYDRTDEVGKAADAAASQALAGLGEKADPFRAIVAGESASGVRRAAEARTRGTSEVGKIRTSIARERGSRLQQIGSDLQKTIEDIANQSAVGGSKQSQALAQARANENLAKLKGRETRKTVRLQGRQNRRGERQKQAGRIDYLNKQGGGGGDATGRPGSRTDRQRALALIRNDLSAVPAGKRKGIKWGVVRDNLVAKRGVDPAVARWAVNFIRKPKKNKRAKGTVGSVGKFHQTGG